MTDPKAIAEGLGSLARRLVNGVGASNALDVEVECVMFQPDDEFASVRANAAGTKVIYTRHDGTEAAHWAPDWTLNRLKASLAVRALLEERDG